MKFEIKHRYSGAALFSGGADSLRLCVEARRLNDACVVASWPMYRGVDGEILEMAE